MRAAFAAVSGATFLARGGGDCTAAEAACVRRTSRSAAAAPCLSSQRGAKSEYASFSQVRANGHPPASTSAASSSSSAASAASRAAVSGSTDPPPPFPDPGLRPRFATGSTPSAASRAPRFILRFSRLRSRADSCVRSEASIFFSASSRASTFTSATSSSPTRSSTSTNLSTSRLVFVDAWSAVSSPPRESRAPPPSALFAAPPPTSPAAPSSVESRAMPSRCFRVCLASRSRSALLSCFLVSSLSSFVPPKRASSPDLAARSGAARSSTPTMSNSAKARSPAASSSSSLVGFRCAARSIACSGEMPSSRAMSATVACFTPSQMCAMVRADATRVSQFLCFRNPRTFCAEEGSVRDGAVSLFPAGTGRAAQDGSGGAPTCLDVMTARVRSKQEK